MDDAEIEFAYQVDRHGNLAPTKTDGSARTVPIPRELAGSSPSTNKGRLSCGPDDFVFATRSGRPFGHATSLGPSEPRKSERSIARPADVSDPACRRRSRASVPCPAWRRPSMHSFRHTVASRAVLAGESVDEIAFLLGHRDANVTRAVYVRELADARRRTMRRSRIAAEFADVLGAGPPQDVGRLRRPGRGAQSSRRRMASRL